MKRLLKIKVATHPNGYSLDFEGQKVDGGFMYHTLDDLVKGFMIHIGMNITEQLDMTAIDNFLAASIRCSDVKKNQKEIERLKLDLKMMTGRRNGLAARLIKERERSIRLAQAMWKLREEFKANKEVYARIYDVVHGTETLKPLTLQGIIKSKDVKP